ncbi:hypothetical protein ABTX60_15760 [Streptomyces sp. NPDC126510]|uniref:hypothetical protein n=1 Tax=Streptomyces sp. NPDC126510 TaxID=3155317 RepID=UPI00331A5D16
MAQASVILESARVSPVHRPSADVPGVNAAAGDETETSSRKSGEETRQICCVFFESPGKRSDGG